MDGHIGGAQNETKTLQGPGREWSSLSYFAHINPEACHALKQRGGVSDEQSSGDARVEFASRLSHWSKNPPTNENNVRLYETRMAMPRWFSDLGSSRERI